MEAPYIRSNVSLSSPIVSMLDVTDIRNPLDTKAIEQYLTNLPSSATRGSEVPEFKAPFTIKQFRFGQSNPTYLIIDAANKHYVLRRKPSANSKLVSRSAHAIEREFLILDGIYKCNKSVPAERAVPVPKVYVLCEDESVTEAVFYVMEYIEGRPIKRPDLPGVPESEKAKYWDAIMTTISSIHSLDGNELVKYLPAKHFPQFQPEKLAKSKGGPSYFQRQIKTLSGVAQLQSKTVNPIPNFEALIRYTAEHAPKDPSKLTLIHGDCKIDNFLFHPTEPKIIAVLDWELCTFGHPLFDLANFLQPFEMPNELNNAFFRPDKVNMGREIPGSRDAVYEKLRLYQKKLGYPWNDDIPSNNPVDLWTLGVIFGILRLCVISQGVAMRVAKGTASSANAAGFSSLYILLSDLAMEIIEKSSKL